MTYLEATMCTSNDTSLATSLTDGNKDIPILTWDAVVNDESNLWSVIVPAVANDESIVEHENRPTGTCCTDNEDVIAKEIKYAVKDLVTKDFLKLIEE